MTSSDFGLNFTWTKMPANLQKTFTLSVDPTSATSLYAVTPARLFPHLISQSKPRYAPRILGIYHFMCLTGA